MTAEEQLKEIYESQEPVVIEKKGTSKDCRGRKFITPGTTFIGNSGVYLAAEHIDLIANLVVERLKQGDKDDKASRDSYENIFSSNMASGV